MKNLYLFCSLLLLFSCKAKETLAPADFVASRQAIDELCRGQLDILNYPGLAISVYQDGRPLYSQGYGFADIEAELTINPQKSLFRIGSISKTLTASVLCKMADRGAINLDVPIAQYMPDLPEDKRKLTLRQLAGHLAGIRHYNGLEFLSNRPYEDVLDPLSVFIQDTLLFAAGEQYAYSTYGWTLVSAVMQRASNQAFLALMQRELLAPLHLQHLRPDHKDSIQYNRVTYYMPFGDSLLVAPEVDQSNKWAGGGFIGSADAVAQFGVAHMHSGFLSQRALETCITSQSLADGKATNYGIGFRSGVDEQSRKWYGHSGGSVGGTSMLLIYPEEKLVIVTLVNKSSAKMDNLAWRIADIVLAKRE